MPHIPILQPFEAPKDVKAGYDDFHQRMSFPAPPNFIMTQGHSATVVRGTWDVVRNVLVLGLIPRWTKEMIFVAISIDRQCRYCEAAHIACCRMFGVDPKTLQTLVQNLDALTDPKLHAMIRFALKCSRNPQADRTRLRNPSPTRVKPVGNYGISCDGCSCCLCQHHRRCHGDGTGRNARGSLNDSHASPPHHARPTLAGPAAGQLLPGSVCLWFCLQRVFCYICSGANGQSVCPPSRSPESTALIPPRKRRAFSCAGGTMPTCGITIGRIIRFGQWRSSRCCWLPGSWPGVFRFTDSLATAPVRATITLPAAA